MILLSEYHASFIRLRRVLLLCSDIRLTPCGIRFASFRANRIPLKPQGFNITIAAAIISLFAKAKNITKKAEKERASRNFVTALLSLLFLLQVSHLFNKCTGLCPYPYFISPLRTSSLVGRLLFYSSVLRLRIQPAASRGHSAMRSLIIVGEEAVISLASAIP